jgi:diguanylate cyclase (GGDEF)-like protein
VCAAGATADAPGAAEAAAAVASALAGRQPPSPVAYPCTNVLGPRWFELHAEPLLLADGQPGVLLLHVDVTTTGQRANMLRTAVLHDPLTGLPNRQLLNERLGSAIRRLGQLGSLAVLSLTVHGLTEVRRQHGRELADLVLAELAPRWARQVPPGDMLGRWDDEEFVVLVENADARQANDLASRLQAEEFGRVRLGGTEVEVPVTVSIGVCMLRDETNALELINAAGGGASTPEQSPLPPPRPAPRR